MILRTEEPLELRINKEIITTAPNNARIPVASVREKEAKIEMC